MRELHLFAGAGGGILAGALLGHTCVGAVETDPYCRAVLAARQADGCLPPFPVHEDVCDFDGRPWRGRVDVVCAGFPCQPWSTAGKRRGAADARHLWPEAARIVGEARPTLVFAENVSLGAMEQPYRDLRGMGYTVAPALNLGACDIGPLQLAGSTYSMYHRHRWWLLAADLDRERQQERPLSSRPGRFQQATASTDGGPRDPDGAGPSLGVCLGSDPRAQRATALGTAWWSSASRLVRMVSRHARGMDSRRKRIHALSNAQVPICAALAFELLLTEIQAMAGLLEAEYMKQPPE